MKHLSFLLLLPGLLSGCALIMNGRTQAVGFSSSPSGAVCSAEGTVVRTPAAMHLQRAKSYTFVCYKEGYEEASVVLVPKLSEWLWGDVLFAVLPGLYADFRSGAAYKLTPDSVHFTLIKGGESAPASVERLEGLETPEEGYRFLLGLSYDKASIIWEKLSEKNKKNILGYILREKVRTRTVQKNSQAGFVTIPGARTLRENLPESEAQFLRWFLPKYSEIKVEVQ